MTSPASVALTNLLMGTLKPAALPVALWAPSQVLPPPLDPSATRRTAAAVTNSPLTVPTSAGWRQFLDPEVHSLFTASAFPSSLMF